MILNPVRNPPAILSNTHNTILSLCKLGKLKEALQALFGTPNNLDSSTYSSILQLCIDRNAKTEGRVVHEHLRSIGYQSDLRLDNKLLIFYGRTGEVDDARKVFDGMSRRTAVSWTALISAYSQHGFSERAVEAFVLMRRSGVYANEFTFGSVVRACVGLGCTRTGGQVHGYALKSGVSDNIFVMTALMDLHFKCGSVMDARFAFESMRERDLVSWNAMIGGYALQGLGHESFNLFSSMMRKGISFDHFTFSSTLKACGRMKVSANVSQVHAVIVRLGFMDDSIVSSSLIDAYAKSRSMRSARLVFETLQDKDLISFTALVTGYTQQKHGMFDLSELLGSINQMGIQMDHITTCSIISLCANAAWASLGRQIHACAVKIQSRSDLALSNALVNMYAKIGEIKDARRAFDEMHTRNTISWTSIINGYGKHGFGEDAIILFEKMEYQGIKPNDVTFLSLLFACSHTGLTEKGWTVFNSMVCKYGIRPRAEHYSCVVDLLARGGQLKEAYDFLCKFNIVPNATIWGTLLGASRLHTNMIFGKMAAEHLFDVDPESSVNYVVLANIYAASGLWENACKIRKLMEQDCRKKNVGWSSVLTDQKTLFLEGG